MPEPSPIPEPPAPRRAPVYSRLWHLDADGRRHHGRRHWDPAAIEAFVALAATVDRLYPPDWSDVAAVRFRPSGDDRPFAEIRTDDPDHLVLMMCGQTLHISRRQQIDSAEFRAVFARCACRASTSAIWRS